MTDLLKDINITLKPGSEIEFAKELKHIYQNQINEIKKIKPQSGAETSKLLTEATDSIITLLYKELSKQLNTEPDIAVVSLGSYGRVELNPFSDIDLLFLYPNDDDENVKDFISKMLYILWDMKLELGHSTRTIKNVISMASKDITFKTSIIDHRLLCGKDSLYEEFKETVAKIFKKNRYSYYQSLLGIMNYYRQSLGENVLLKEPNIKDSLGSLRGVHLIRWLGYNFFQNRSLLSLNEFLDIDKETLTRLEDNFDYFLKLRNKLHFLVDRKEDLMLLEHQEELSKDTLLPESAKDMDDASKERIQIETFMRGFYKRAKEVYNFICTVIDLYEIEANKYRQFTRFLNRRKTVDDVFMIINNKLFFRKHVNQLDFSPQFIMSIFIHIQHHGSRLSVEIEKYIKSHIKDINSDFRMDKSGFKLFQEIVTGERNLYHTLSIMNHVGFLPAYLPFFNELDCTVQHDYYHAYTVDEHTLQGIKKIEELYHTENHGISFFKDQLLQLEQDQRFLLVHSIFFHDIGKGRPGNHVKNGEKMIDIVTDSFPFSEHEKRLLAFVVNEHLIMAHNSQRRNFQDIKILYSFAMKVQSKEALDLLLLLTYADMASVAPNVFTIWKGELLKELYYKTLKLFLESPKGQLPSIQKQDYDKIKKNILEQLGEEEKSFAPTFFDYIDPNFVIDSELEEIVETMNIFKKSPDQCVLRSEEKLDSYIVKFYGKDQVGFLSRIALLLASNAISIHSSKLYSKDSGYIVAHFTVSSIFTNFEIGEDRWEDIKKNLDPFLNKKLSDLEPIFTGKKKGFPLKKQQGVAPKTKVFFDNNLSDNITVIEIHCEDRFGLLYQISSLLNLKEIRIKSAFINTRGYQAIDTFYVQQYNGQQVIEEAIIEEVKDFLTEELNKYFSI